jgi:cytochrome c peroxidase
MVVERLKENKKYVTLFQEHYGEKIFEDIDQAYKAMGQAIEAFEKTKTFAPFDTK